MGRSSEDHPGGTLNRLGELRARSPPGSLQKPRRPRPRLAAASESDSRPGAPAAGMHHGTDQEPPGASGRGPRAPASPTHGDRRVRR
eukprot:765518-Hanusia_phi.AAC.16